VAVFLAEEVLSGEREVSELARPGFVLARFVRSDDGFEERGGELSGRGGHRVGGERSWSRDRGCSGSGRGDGSRSIDILHRRLDPRLARRMTLSDPASETAAIGLVTEGEGEEGKSVNVGRGARKNSNEPDSRTRLS
jgi:hypothetical protein